MLLPTKTFNYKLKQLIQVEQNNKKASKEKEKNGYQTKCDFKLVVSDEELVLMSSFLSFSLQLLCVPNENQMKIKKYPQIHQNREERKRN